MSDPIKTAQTILAEAGKQRMPRLDVDAFAELARAYLATRGDTLATVGQIYVTPTAAAAFAAVERIYSDEDARRELTELLIDAKQEEDETRWRMRVRSTGLDIQARVSREGRLLVVTHVNVRDGNVGGRRG